MEPVFPSAKDYKSHLLEIGEVNESDCGGIYHRVLIRNFLGPLKVAFMFGTGHQ